MFGFHPAEYAIGMGRNVIVAGTNATAVDAVGLAVLGEDSTAAAHLEMAHSATHAINAKKISDSDLGIFMEAEKFMA